MNYTINDLLKFANEHKASDLHVSAGTYAKCRINGDLCDITKEILTPEETKELLSPLLSPRLQEMLDEYGEADFSHAIEGLGRYRVNVFRQKQSLASVIRLIGTDIPEPGQLGVPDSVVALTKKKRGLVLVTGPTGSGKSTTLASLINVINDTYRKHVITLEDPIEYLHKHKESVVNQREIGEDTQSYGHALRAALREDPDVILVGEMRDLDTIATALTAAETGHLVFSTLHTIGAAPTIDRVIDVFPPHQQQQIRVQLAGVLEAVVSQQLMKTADGKGRVAAYEVMHANPAIKNLIREGKTHQIPSIIQTSRKLGMMTMDDALTDLYRRMVISADTAIEFAQDPLTLQTKLI